jgi:hypothetical protein
MPDEIVERFQTLELRDCGRPLSGSTIADWERTIGLRLPAEYRRFLEVFNGGYFYPRYYGFVFPVDFSNLPSPRPLWWDAIGVFTFFGLHEPWNWRDLEGCRATHEGRIAAGTIPIAEAANDLILLDCQHGGELVLWSRERELELDPEKNRFPLAKSFLEFACKIQRQPREEWLDNITASKEPFVSIQLHELDGLKAWVSQNGPLPTLPDAGVGLLRETADAKDFDGSEWLLCQGVSPTGPLKTGLKTPIQVADENNCGDIIVLLLEHGANPDHLFRDGHKPRQYSLDFLTQWQAGERRPRRIAPNSP